MDHWHLVGARPFVLINFNFVQKESRENVLIWPCIEFSSAHEVVMYKYFYLRSGSGKCAFHSN